MTPSKLGLARLKFAQGASAFGQKGGSSTSEAKKRACSASIEKARKVRHLANCQRLLAEGRLFRIEGTDFLGCRAVCVRKVGRSGVHLVKKVDSLENENPS